MECHKFVFFRGSIVCFPWSWPGNTHVCAILEALLQGFSFKTSSFVTNSRMPEDPWDDPGIFSYVCLIFMVFFFLP